MNVTGKFHLWKQLKSFFLNLYHITLLLMIDKINILVHVVGTNVLKQVINVIL